MSVRAGVVEGGCGVGGDVKAEARRAWKMYETRYTMIRTHRSTAKRD